MAVAPPRLRESALAPSPCYPPPRSEREREECSRLEEALRKANLEPECLRPIGRGTDSVVFVHCRTGGAVKVRRLDSRKSLSAEGLALLYLSAASPEKLAPRVFAFSSRFVHMEFIEGVRVADFLRSDPSEEEARRVACECLRKAALMDLLGVDHGQLSRAHEHVILAGRELEPVFIDFGDSSFSRRPHNLTSIWSFLRNSGLLGSLGAEFAALEFARALKRGEELALRRLGEACGWALPLELRARGPPRGQAAAPVAPAA